VVNEIVFGGVKFVGQCIMMSVSFVLFLGCVSVLLRKGCFVL